MEIIETEDVEKAKRMIKEKKKPVIIKATSDIFNRKMVEHGKFDILLSPESIEGKDMLKYLNSGLNNVTAKIAAKNKVSIGINIEKIRMLQKKDKAILTSRIMQNIKICRKMKTKISMIGCKDYRNGMSLLLSLGASTKQAREAISF